MLDTTHKVAVLGTSGTVGSLTGGIIAQQGLKVYFLSRTPEGANRGLKKAVAQARSEVISRNIICGDYDSLLEKALSEADLIIESVTEDLTAKRQMYELVEQYRKPDTIVGTTTSSLLLSDLSHGRSESFRKNFLSTHFYNPPGKMLACEIASQSETAPEIYNLVKDFLEHKLQRIVIPVNDTAGFAGNRIAFLLFNRITKLVEQHGVEMMDYLIGPYTGRLMPPLATIDLVGLDIHRAIIESLYEHTNDSMHNDLVLPKYIKKMIDNGTLGRKTKCGFYKKLESGKYVFMDPETCDYIPAIEPHIAFVEKAKHLIRMGMYKEAFDIIKTAHCEEADIVMNFLCMYVAYSYSRIGEVTKPEYGIQGIDRVMSHGFNWAPPSLIIEMLGGKQCVMELLEEKGFDIPKALIEESKKPEQISNAGKYFVAK